VCGNGWRRERENPPHCFPGRLHRRRFGFSFHSLASGLDLPERDGLPWQYRPPQDFHSVLRLLVPVDFRFFNDRPIGRPFSARLPDLCGERPGLRSGLGDSFVLEQRGAGSTLCFSIAKILGRPAVQRLVNQVHLEVADSTLKRYEKYIILLFGFVPVVSFDVISYAAGLTVLTYWEFLPLVCIAQIPSALFYSLLVNRIDRGTLDAYWIIGAFLFFPAGHWRLDPPRLIRALEEVD